ncbi:methyl-accepting chemotaxis protein, partial [Campylobacter jejuni]|nr:methyl-accepting chemotaxis protein [Campylobacter jejuni]EEU7336612.1 methyl-accepting chemotaxis protein [Campylobacter jejuni]
MNSIKIKVSLIANLIAIFALIILGIVSFYFTKKSLYESTLNNQVDLLRVAQSAVEDFKTKNLSIVNNLAQDIQDLPMSSLETQEEIFNNVAPILKNYRHSADALAVYIGLDNGNSIVSQKESDDKKVNAIINSKANNYDARERGWYQEALKTNQIYINPVYLDPVSNEHVFTYSKALYKNGKFIGVIAIDILSKELQENITNIPGNTLLFNENKIFAAKNKKLLDPSIDHSPVLNAYKANGDYNSFTYGLKGQERLGTCTKIFTYTACITESADIINKPIHKAAFIQVIVVIIVVAFSVILLYFIVSKYLSPLAAIQTGLNSFFDFI